MAFTLFKQKWQRVTFYVVLGFVVVIMLLSLALNVYFSPMLESKLKSSIAESSDSLYKIEFSKASLNLLQGKVVIDDATLKVDKAVYNKKKKAGTAPNNLYDIRVNQIRITGANPLKYFFSRKAAISKIVLNEPSIDMSYEANNTEDKPKGDKRTIWQRMSKTLKSARVGEIWLNNLKFRHTDYSHKKPLRTEVRELNLKATDLFIASTTQADTSRFFYCSDIVTEVNNYNGKTPNGLYFYKVKSIKLSTKSKQLTLIGATLKPFNRLLFFNKTRSERFDLSFDTIRLNNFNFISYYRYRTFTASSLSASHGVADIFGAPNKIPNYQKDAAASFPHMALRKLDFGLRIDTINLKKVHIIYSEFNKKSQKNGSITFSNTSGQIFNVTNNKKALKKNNISTIKLTTYFMDRGRLDVTFKLNLTADNAAFSYKGTLGPMPLSALNKAIGPISMVKVASGSVTRFDFDVDATRYAAKGKMTFLYKDLKINILKRDEESGKLKKKGLTSLLANYLVIERNNPDEPGKQPRSANITFVRPLNYPFFKIAWKTLFAGVKECAGVSEMDEKRANAKMSEGDLEKQRGEKDD
ncbi:hypothetical protein EOD41_08100 [Mucilaginibacter limnophilus]|uniref:DUF748 domain-containing protein n=1 Tax=Mucilaginibacter limnophilus TaxID=1932778 RepID=A0A437MWB0_9SPHI|nr:hypothetical protein [Mucilaginibacter limnophilus]RVU01907.1 hypothetical protein EOD41_08100 [Mucilaginibacter limnophilus]